MNENQLALEKFLLDVDCLNELNKYTAKSNIFDILKISDQEIRHSNFLAWLLDTNESHGLGDTIIKKLISQIVSENIEHFHNNNIETSDIMLIDYDSFSVLREWKNIDLLLISHDLKICIAFENKVWSKEGNNQLIRYKDILENLYPEYKKILIYLTPQGDDPSDTESWLQFSYEQLVSVLEDVINYNKNLTPDILLLIQHYIETVRRNIVGDSELIKLCEKIYQKHKVALDLIYDNRPDDQFNVSEIIDELIKEYEKETGHIQVIDNMLTKTLKRFTTPAMLSIIPINTAIAGGWGNGYSFLYEIVNNKDKIYIKAVASNVDFERVTKLVSIGLKVSNKKPSSRTEWKWKTITTWPVMSIKDINYNSLDDDEKNDFIQKLKKNLNKAFDEIYKFEKQVQNNWT